MIKFLTKDLLDIKEGLEQLATLSERSEIPFNLKWRTSRFLVKLKEDYTSFMAEKQKLLEIYGTEIFEDGKDKKGDSLPIGTGNYSIHQEKRDEYKEKLEKLLLEEIEISGVYKFKFSELEEIKGINVNTLYLLNTIIDVPDDKDKPE